MDQQSPDWKSLYLSEQCRCEEEQCRREVAESAQKDQHRQKEAEQAEEKAEEKTRNIDTMAKNEEEYRKIAARPLKLLGAGVSGHVFVVDDHTVVKVALKRGDAYTDNESLQDHLIERKIYERLGKHDRICEFKYTIDRGLVLERLKQCLRERLVDFQKRNMLPSYEERFRWSIQAAQGCAYIHEKGVLQGDIGCHNLLLDENDNVKLCDFGGSSIDGSKLLCSPGTGFRRPTNDEDTINIKDELFALGSTIYEIWTTRKPYQDDSRCDADYWTVLDHFKNQRFPDLTGILPASIIMKCWLGYHRSAAEVVIDLEALLESTNDKVDKVAQQSILPLLHKCRFSLLSTTTFAIVLVAMLMYSNTTPYSLLRQTSSGSMNTSVYSARCPKQTGHSEGRVVDPNNASLGAALRHSRRVLIGFGLVQSWNVRVVTLCLSSASHLV